jgi:hypothetical protein
MVKKEGAGQNINVRLSTTLLERVDAYIVMLSEQNPGLTLNRSDIIRMAVERLDAPAPAAKPKKAAK